MTLRVWRVVVITYKTCLTIAVGQAQVSRDPRYATGGGRRNGLAVQADCAIRIDETVFALKGGGLANAGIVAPIANQT
jgi:hypothetical protein